MSKIKIKLENGDEKAVSKEHLEKIKEEGIVFEVVKVNENESKKIAEQEKTISSLMKKIDQLEAELADDKGKDELQQIIKILKEENASLATKVKKQTGVDKNATTYNEFIKDFDNKQEFDCIVKSLNKSIAEVSSKEKSAIIAGILKKRGV